MFEYENYYKVYNARAAEDYFDLSLIHILDLVAREYGIQEEDKAIIIKYYKCELIGQILDWMKDGMRYDIVKQFHRICSLFEGSTQIAFQRSAGQADFFP